MSGFVLAALATLATLATLAAPQDRPRTVFRAETTVVYVDVLVERNGRPVSDLSSDDFVILDDGEPRPLVFVERERAPLELLLLLDTSSSMVGSRLRHLKDASSAVVEALEPNDTAAILTFSHHTSLRQTSTHDREALHDAVGALRAYGNTAWRDALFTALATERPIGRRQLVMLFTDGEDTYSWLSEDAIVGVAQESNAVVYAVTSEGPGFALGVRTERERQALRTLREARSRRLSGLRGVTRATGGKLLEMDASEELKAAFLEILRESGARYLLGFTPESPVRPGWHELEVKVENEGRGVDVHARRGYYFEP